MDGELKVLNKLLANIMGTLHFYMTIKILK